MNTVSAHASSLCIHCGTTLLSYQQNFCCVGCETVYHLLQSEGLQDYHKLKDPKLSPLVGYFSGKKDLEWIKKLPGYQDGELELGVEGVQCSACVWALEKLAQKKGVCEIQVDPNVGVMSLRFDQATYPLDDYLELVQKLGYRITTPDGKKSGLSGLLIRLGICSAVAMNTMFLAISFYLGLAKESPELVAVFANLNFYLSFISVFVGGSYFFGKAMAAISERVLHFDLPIALGILAAFVGSVWAHIQKNFDGAYFDTLNIFIALMLAGRYVQLKFVERNQQALQKDKPFAQMTAWIFKGESGQLKEVNLKALQAGDQILVQPGMIVPVDSEVLANEHQSEFEFSQSLINGESRPKAVVDGEMIEAGSILVSTQAATVRALQPFQESYLDRIHLKSSQSPIESYFKEWFTKWYVIIVVLMSGVGFAAWYSVAGLDKAIQVSLAVLVVSCPCAIGLAMPLARTLANKRLLHWGVVALNPNLLTKWVDLKKMVFDKTGTLTLAELELCNSQALQSLSEFHKQILFTATSKSLHPASRALFQNLAKYNYSLLPCVVSEEPGIGLHIECEGQSYFLGRKKTRAEQDSEYNVSFYHQEKLLVSVGLRESYLNQAKKVIQVINKKFKVSILSGDKQKRVNKAACDLGLDLQNVFGDLKPNDKQSVVAQINENDTLVLGDGLNDAAAMSQSYLSGAPLSSRSAVTSQADFYFVSNGLDWLLQVSKLAKRMHRLSVLQIAFAVLYNVGLISLSLMGFVTPLTCAIVMPISSILVLAVTTTYMRRA